MGVQMPRNSRDVLPSRGAAAVRRYTGAPWGSIAGLLLVGLAGLPLLRNSPPSAGLAALPWIFTPLLAAWAWAYAARKADSRAPAAFRAFQGAAILGAGAHLVYALRGHAAFQEAGTGIPYLLLLPALSMGVGAALVLGLRGRQVWIPRLAADSTLLLLAVLAAALRFLVEPSMGAGAADPLARTLLTAAAAVTVIPVFLAAQVALRRGTALSGWTGALLLMATLAFAAAALGSLGATPTTPFTLAHPTGILGLAGWALFAAAGYSTRPMPAAGNGSPLRRSRADAIRKLLVPGCAVFLAVAVLDMGLGRPPRPETVLAVAMLAMALAIRTGQTSSIADRESAQRRQLAHTRALVSVTHALAGTTDLDQTLRVISESARSVFGTRGAGIELLTEDGKGLETRSAVGLPREVLGLRFPIAGSFTGWVVQHEEPRATVDPSRDPYIQPQSLSFLGRWPVAAAPIHFHGETLGALFACIRREPFDAEELELMGALAQQAAIAIQQARLFEQVTIMSITDPLTGLANRRQLEHELPREFAGARRGRDLTVVIFDLDRFKNYNDTHGHLAGDEALQAFAESLQKETRAMNLAARYGGDEFVAVLAGTDAAGARTFVQRVRAEFARRVDILGRGRLTVSAGLAQYAPEMADPEELLRAADDELYRTKPHARA